jgi:DNA-binding NtrC family response regulator
VNRKKCSFPILIVDDEDFILKSMAKLLLYHGFSQVTCVQDARRVMSTLRSQPISLVLLDINMPYLNGRELLKEIRAEFPATLIVMVSAVNDLDVAVECMKLGAFDYLVKAVEPAKLIALVGRIASLSELEGEYLSLREHLLSEELERPECFEGIVTKSEKMRLIFRYLESVAKTQHPILISGETGTGKELIAQAVHELSGLSGDFVAVNSSGYDDALFSDSLFGHERGAYTGAEGKRRGLVESAAGGTLFLDEIGDLPLQSQVKLLRLFESREYYPIGSDVKKYSSARIVVATNIDLIKAVAEGRFRKDLFYRLKIHTVGLPPLRDRREDIPLLCGVFASAAAKEFGKPAPIIPKSLARLLMGHEYPGNVRELKALVYNAVSMAKGDTLSAEHFPDISHGSPWDGVMEEPFLFQGAAIPTIREAIHQLIDESLRRTGGNQSKAARLLGISQQALSKRMRNGY